MSTSKPTEKLKQTRGLKGLFVRTGERLSKPRQRTQSESDTSKALQRLELEDIDLESFEEDDDCFEKYHNMLPRIWPNRFLSEPHGRVRSTSAGATTFSVNATLPDGKQTLGTASGI
ncbi:uncharacterized protein LOC117121807 [Anneissia japonica]|uniref:uncharacterized protein LOC117121807 n=1 Tax=Anneissia japonica TaxID=1529436 RepID=UPI001425A644|nr:uncharacterized protein LOC117121807 [Anneissia japonica]